MPRPNTSTHPIANYRREHKVTREELAKRLGCKPGSIQDYELGRRTVPVRVALRFAWIIGGAQGVEEWIANQTRIHEQSLRRMHAQAKF